MQQETSPDDRLRIESRKIEGTKRKRLIVVCCARCGELAAAANEFERAVTLATHIRQSVPCCEAWER